jgi:hypothetical protein
MAVLHNQHSFPFGSRAGGSLSLFSYKKERKERRRALFLRNRLSNEGENFSATIIPYLPEKGNSKLQLPH